MSNAALAGRIVRLAVLLCVGVAFLVGCSTRKVTSPVSSGPTAIEPLSNIASDNTANSSAVGIDKGENVELAEKAEGSMSTGSFIARGSGENLSDKVNISAKSDKKEAAALSGVMPSGDSTADSMSGAMARPGEFEVEEEVNVADNGDAAIKIPGVLQSGETREGIEVGQPISIASSGMNRADNNINNENNNGITAAKGASDSLLKPSNPVLSSLKIEQIGDRKNRVVAQISSAGVYTVRRTAPSEYVVSIKGASIAKGTQTVIVAPPDTGLIRSVRAVEKNGDLLLRVFVRPGAVLSPSASSGQIFLTAMHQSELGDAPYAQLADGKGKKKADQAGHPENEGEGKVENQEEAEGDEGGDQVAAPNVPSEEEQNTDENEIAALLEGEPKYTGRLISLDLQDTDIDNALRIIAEVSNLNIITSQGVQGKVTLRLVDVPWDQALDVILKTNGLDKVQEGNVIRVAPVNKLKEEREILKEAQRADEDLQPLLVRYIRISYSNAEDLKPLIETVLTERGSVAVDSRTNQIIVKDIQRGIANVAQLVSKLDLRTPQVLLETQIVEASRSFLRDLGSEVGFNVIQSPETGNATGKNFPNSIQVQGSAGGGQSAISFPAAVDNIGSAVTALFASADGAEALSLRLSSLEQEGKVKIISRPSVATVNNKKAVIKSVEKIRVKTPDSGLSVATGEGAVSSGASAVATETFEVGIVLEVTPQASPDYYVLLDINAKSSTLGSTVVDGIPSEVERSATSTVLVSSGQTFALGGIYKITDKDTLDGVPFFKDLPGFGHFFRRSLVDNSHEELIFFITPRIVEGSFDDAAMKATL